MDAPATPNSSFVDRRWRGAPAAAARAVFAALLLAAALDACGIEGTTTAGGGIGGTGISAGSRIGYGAITAFGSIYVNGVRYTTDTAAIVKDGISITERELRVGMTVEVQGEAVSDTEASAQTILVEETVAGIVEAKAANHLIVLGQTVLIDEATRFDTDLPDLAAIEVGQSVEVYGLVQAPGVIEAAFIQRHPQTGGLTVRGLVDTHDMATKTFTVGTVIVEYGAAATNHMPPGAWLGLVVKAKGGACSATPVCGTFSALEVEPERLGAAEAGRAEVEGFVTAVHGSAQFMLGNQPVVIDPATQFSGGAAADIERGAKLEVEGELTGGVLHAATIVFRHNARAEAAVAAVNFEAGTIALADLPGVAVSVNGQTRFKGGFGGLRDIVPGDRVRIRGHAGANNTLIAADTYQEHSPNSGVVLQGPVLVLARPKLMILGIPVDTRAVRSFRDGRNRALDAAAFFDALDIGTVVKASGARSVADSIVRERIEIEDRTFLSSPRAPDGASRRARARSP